jgi:hypothetical protein
MGAFPNSDRSESARFTPPPVANRHPNAPAYGLGEPINKSPFADGDLLRVLKPNNP